MQRRSTRARQLAPPGLCRQAVSWTCSAETNHIVLSLAERGRGSPMTRVKRRCTSRSCGMLRPNLPGRSEKTLHSNTTHVVHRTSYAQFVSGSSPQERLFPTRDWPGGQTPILATRESSGRQQEDRSPPRDPFSSGPAVATTRLGVGSSVVGLTAECLYPPSI